MIDNQFENFMNSITISKYKQAYFLEIYQGFCGLCGKTSRFYSAVVNLRFVTKKTVRWYLGIAMYTVLDFTKFCLL